MFKAQGMRDPCRPEADYKSAQSETGKYLSQSDDLKEPVVSADVKAFIT